MTLASSTFRLLQEWDGTVVEVGEDEFTAELRDLTEPGTHREEATFDMADVCADDRPLLVLGAVFRWRIGYRMSATGQRERCSLLDFIRSLRWRKSDVEAVARRAKRLQALFPLPRQADGS